MYIEIQDNEKIKQDMKTTIEYLNEKWGAIFSPRLEGDILYFTRRVYTGPTDYTAVVHTIRVPENISSPMLQREVAMGREYLNTFLPRYLKYHAISCYFKEHVENGMMEFNFVVDFQYEGD